MHSALLLALIPAVSAAADETPDEHHQFEEIIVSATPLERTVEELAQPTSILSGDALARKQAASIGETLADELGVSASYFGPIASRPVIRGQFGERVRVLSNALDSLDASALSEDHAVSIDSILARSVEVVRGPATLLYGSGAAGGLVNVVDFRIAESAPEVPFGGALALNADSALGTRAGALRLDFGSERIAYHLDGFRRDTDDVETPQGSAPNTSSATDGGALGVSLVGNNGFVGLSASRYGSLYGVPQSEAGDEDESVRIDLDQSRYDLRARYVFGGLIEQVEMRVAHNDYRHIELEGSEIGTRFDTRGTDARLEFQHRARGKWQGAFGLQYKRIDFAAEGEEAFVPDSDSSQMSIFAFEELGLSEDWTLQASARIERQVLETAGTPAFKDTAIGASLGSIWTLPRALSVAVNVALTERHPNAAELFADGPHVAVQRYERGALAVGTGSLAKERSMNVDLTLRGSGGRFEWTVVGFVNNVDDYVLLAPTSEQIDGLQVFDVVQADVEMYGAEAELLADVFATENGHLHARLFVDFVHGEQADSGAYLPRLPPLRWGAGLHFSGARIDANLSATVNEAQHKTAGSELRTGSFTMLDAELSYSFADPALLVFIKATNISDELARRHTSPLKDILPLPGRSLHAGLRLDF